MSKVIEVLIPNHPEFRTSCGNCASGQTVVLVAPGDAVVERQVYMTLKIHQA